MQEEFHEIRVEYDRALIGLAGLVTSQAKLKSAREERFEAIHTDCDPNS